MGAISKALSRRQGQILTCWLQQARQLPSAIGLTDDELVDSLPVYFHHAAAALGDQTLTRSLEDVVEIHIGVRLFQGFTAEDVAAEYALLQSAMMSALNEAAPRPTSDEAARIAEMISGARHDAFRVFNARSIEDEQLEKRYLRLIDQICLSGLSPSGDGG